MNLHLIFGCCLDFFLHLLCFVKFCKSTQNLVEMASKHTQGDVGGNGNRVESIPGVSDIPEGYSKALLCCELLKPCRHAVI